MDERTRVKWCSLLTFGLTMAGYRWDLEKTQKTEKAQDCCWNEFRTGMRKKLPTCQQTLWELNMVNRCMKQEREREKEESDVLFHPSFILKKTFFFHFTGKIYCPQLFTSRESLAHKIIGRSAYKSIFWIFGFKYTVLRSSVLSIGHMGKKWQNIALFRS